MDRQKRDVGGKVRLKRGENEQFLSFFVLNKILSKKNMTFLQHIFLLSVDREAVWHACCSLPHWLCGVVTHQPIEARKWGGVLCHGVHGQG